MVAILVHIYFFIHMANGCTRRECWCTPLPCGAPRPMIFLSCLVSFSLLSGFYSQAYPEHMADRLQIPFGRLTFAKGYSTL